MLNLYSWWLLRQFILIYNFVLDIFITCKYIKKYSVVPKSKIKHFSRIIILQNTKLEILILKLFMIYIYPKSK